MLKELKQSMITAYNEAEELHTDFTTLTDEELLEVKDVIIKRVSRIMEVLDKYVDEKDIVEM